MSLNIHGTHYGLSQNDAIFTKWLLGCVVNVKMQRK